jgi:hypothetical protein
VRIWQLKPLDLSAPDWRASTYQGKTIVRAETEADARRLAARAFGIATEFVPGRPVAIIPWDHPRLVAAAVLVGSKYDPDGDEEILSPLATSRAGWSRRRTDGS